MEMMIKPVDKKTDVPMDLLLLADPSEEMIRRYLTDGRCFIAEIDDEVIGVIILLSKNSETIEIMNLAVHENWQGKGVGTKLLFKAQEEAKLQNAKRLEIGTGNSSLKQLGLYQRCGFRMFEIWEDFFITHYEDPIYENGIPCVDMVRLKIDF